MTDTVSTGTMRRRPENGFDAETYFRAAQWYQKWEVFPGIFTPGINPIATICDLIELPGDLSGRRVLDVGSANGCMSLECERRGAAEVIALTPFDLPEFGHRQLAELVGSSRTHFVEGSVYHLDPEELGYFDTVLFCGVLYHLRYPMLAIDNIRRVATRDVFIETQISDAELSAQSRGLPLWRFYRRDELANDYSNWFAPNVSAVLEGFSSAGFEIQLLNADAARGRFKALAREGMPEFLEIDCTEAARYDLLLRPLLGNLESWRRSK